MCGQSSGNRPWNRKFIIDTKVDIHCCVHSPSSSYCALRRKSNKYPIDPALPNNNSSSTVHHCESATPTCLPSGYISSDRPVQHFRFLSIQGQRTEVFFAYSSLLLPLQLLTPIYRDMMRVESQ